MVTLSYRVTDIQTGESWYMEDDFYSYVHFIGELEALNRLWRGELKFQEVRQSSRLTTV
jgi:hypothetical protein